jgi:colicin import membrane protein
MTDDKAELQQQAQRLRDEASTLRQTAEARHDTAQKTCWEKFLVSACLADASKALRDDKAKAYQLERQAREIERDIRKRDFSEREAKRQEQAPAPTQPSPQ